jgi:MFS family permease
MVSWGVPRHRFISLRLASPQFAMFPRFAPSGDHPAIVPHRLIWGIAIGQLVSWGTLYYSLAVLIGPMQEELGWSKVELNAGLTIGLLSASIVAIPVGALIDRYGGYWFMVLGACSGALLLLAWAMTSSLPVFYAIWVGIGLVHACTLNESAYNIVVSNLADHRRAITLITLLSGLSSSVAIPFITLCTETLGWRWALVVLALIHFLIPGMVSAYVLRGIVSARQKDAAAAGATPMIERKPLLHALRNPVFWALAAAFSVHTFIGNGITFHFIPLLLERGHPMSLIVAVMAMHGPSQVAARFVLLMIGGRVSNAGYGLFAFTLMTIGVALLGLSSYFGTLELFVYAMIYGIGTGLLTLVRTNSVIEYLSAYGYGVASGALVIAVALPRTTAAVLFALLWEASGSYDAVLWMALAVSLMGLGAFWLATRWHHNATRITGI